MNKKSEPQSRFALVARNAAIDFANTVFDPQGDPAGTLQSDQDVLAFLKLPDSTPAGGLLQFALELRADLRAILAALAEGTPVRTRLTVRINSVLDAAAEMSRLEHTGDGWKLVTAVRSDSPVSLLLPVARAAAAIVVQGDRAGIRRCANPECVLFFRDVSGRRRWCSMQWCGNRAKVAAHWRRNHS